MITTAQAQVSIKKINSEVFSLTPSALLTFFEIDVTDIAFNLGLSIAASDSIFRFHNNMKLINSNLFWQGNEYIAAPIIAEGFQFVSRGTLPVPKMSIAVNDAGILLLALLKQQISQLDELVGAKVTRIRTFAKFIDAQNFNTNDLPAGFSPDPNAEFPRDVYFIDRKSSENKNGIEFELASLLDVEGIQLPGRLVVSERCTWQYRGEGCLFAGAPIADANDQKILQMLKISALNPKGLYIQNNTYNIGDAVYIQKGSIKYWFVANKNGVISTPPNISDWIADECSKALSGCRLRFQSILPTGSFPACGRTQ